MERIESRPAVQKGLNVPEENKIMKAINVRTRLRLPAHSSLTAASVRIAVLITTQEHSAEVDVATQVQDPELMKQMI